MNYYGAGADLARMKADEEREQAMMNECILIALHNGLTKKEAELCSDGHWACYRCPCENRGSNPVPKVITKSITYIMIQDMQRQMNEVEALYQEYKKMEREG